MKNLTSRVLASILLTFAISAFAQEDGEHRGPRGRGPQLTDEQRTCLQGILGTPGSGERPTHEQMDAAMSSCGVQKPAKRADSSNSAAQ